MRATGDRSPQTQLAGRPLVFTRLAWLFLVLCPLGLVIYTFPDYYRSLLSLDAAIVMYGPWSNPRDLAAALTDLGLSPSGMAFYRLTLDAFQLLSLIALGGLIFWKKSDTWLGLFASFVLIGLGTAIGGGFSAMESIPSPWLELLTFTGVLVWPALFIFFFLFPDGRFIPRWTRLFVPLWVLLLMIWVVLDLVMKQDTDIFQTWGNLFLVISMGAALFSQVFRYLRVSGPIERLQTKWFLFALAIILLWDSFQNFIFVPFLHSTDLPNAQVLLLDLGWQALALLANLSIPLSIGLALFRYRLWDIDLIIRRTLIYGGLTAALALVYAGSVVVLQQVFQAVSGGTGQSQPAIVVSTLAVAVMFSPLRRRVQARIDRRFYRRRYDAERVLSAFAETARRETDLDALSGQLLEVVQNSLQPENAWLWVKETKGQGLR